MPVTGKKTYQRYFTYRNDRICVNKIFQGKIKKFRKIEIFDSKGWKWNSHLNAKNQGDFG